MVWEEQELLSDHSCNYRIESARRDANGASPPIEKPHMLMSFQSRKSITKRRSRAMDSIVISSSLRGVEYFECPMPLTDIRYHDHSRNAELSLLPVIKNQD